jgi:hypothetical protein
MDEQIWKGKNKVLYIGLKISYGPQSCSHSAPHDKPVNWGQDDDKLPRTYKGWGGRIWFGATNYPTYRTSEMSFQYPWVSTLLDMTGLYTGTGGGGEYDIPTHAKERIIREYCPLAFEARNIRGKDGKFIVDEKKSIQKWGWGVTIWEDDWPELKMANLISPSVIFDPSHQLETWYFNLTDGEVETQSESHLDEG